MYFKCYILMHKHFEKGSIPKAIFLTKDAALQALKEDKGYVHWIEECNFYL